MASEKLNARKVATAGPGMHGDGKGLWLVVGARGPDGKPRSKSWVFRYMLRGRAREMGLGSYDDIGLAEARDLARAARRLVHDKINPTDPLEARRAEQLARHLEDARTMTLGDCAKAYIAAHTSEWTNKKHAQQWQKTFGGDNPYVPASISRLPIAAIDEAIVMRILQPLWNATPATASRVRGRIEAVLDWATASKFRPAGPNPARWGGHLEYLLAKPEKPTEDKRLAALPYAEIGAFMAELRQREGVGDRALEFAILTAARAGEVFGADWTEFDLKAKLWTIPASRMKAGRAHEVPLSPDALRILDEMGDLLGRTGLVFKGARTGRPLSHEAMLRVLKAMGRGDLTAHGFRSTFRDWCGDRTNFPRDVAEAALAHTIPNRVEASYRRETALQKRRQLMDAWAKFCAAVPVAGNVVQLGAA